MTRAILREITVGALLDEAVARNPGGDAVVYADRDLRWSYREFGALVDRVAKGLMALGVQRGEKVAVWATNVPHWVVLQFATARIGAVLLTVNTDCRSAELAYLLRHSECENIFLTAGWRDVDYLATLCEVVPEIREQERGNLSSAGFPHLRRCFFLGPEEHRGLYSLPELLARAALVSDADFRARQAGLSAHDVVNLQYTSGTTGFPKGVMLTHHNIVNNGFWIGEIQQLTPADRVCIPVPLFHCFGCVLGVLATVGHAATMLFLETFDPLQAMVAVEKERATALYGVPTMFIAILDHPLFSNYDFSSLRTGIMAGSPCPVKTMRQVIERMHMREVTICYGLTEASPVVTQTRIGDDIRRQTETVGRALPGIEVKVVDPRSGADCPRGVQGEVVCRGYNVMKGYYNQPEETARAVDAGGWLHSGDLGTMDADGYLAITGRLKDIIIRGGENISPREVEESLLQLDGVLDAQVVGVASRKYGEEVGAFIRLREGVTLTAEDVRDGCRGRIARHKIPKYVAFVESYPMTASGKVRKYRLREDARARWPEAMA